EAIWQMLLDGGETFAAVAGDDMHNMKKSAPDPAARPGKGWGQGFAAETTGNAICDALREGRLYAANRGSLKRIQPTRDPMTVWPLTSETVIEFLGDGGQVLERTEQVAPDHGASYQLSGAERYVRARITGPDATKAWTQAYRVAR